MTKPYYERDGITLYNRDCREMSWPSTSVVFTGPPYFEDPAVAGQVMHGLFAEVIICQWNEYSRPPVEMPLMAAHAWINNDAQGLRYQTFCHYGYGPRIRSEVLQYPNVNDGTHPHQIPVALIQRLLLKTPPELVVVDPFCGAGNTLLAAKAFGRKAIGVEINEKWCELAAKRLSGEG